MTLRITDSSMQRQNLLALQRTQERMSQNQQRISTGNRITGPGDDPIASASILDLANSIGVNEQSIKQVDTALSFLSFSEDAISATIDATMRLQEIAASGSSASVAEVDQIKLNVLNLANTQVQGKYLFGGSKTQGSGGNPPFTGPTAAAPTTAVTYNGDTNTVYLNVTQTDSTATNVPGNQAFFGGAQGGASDLFKAIDDLRSGLNTNNQALVQTASTELNNALTSLNTVRSNLGGWQSGLSVIKDTLTNVNLSLQTVQTDKQATDYPTAITQFSSDSTIQSATMNVMAKANKTSLFDYLT